MRAWCVTTCSIQSSSCERRCACAHLSVLRGRVMLAIVLRMPFRCLSLAFFCFIHLPQKARLYLHVQPDSWHVKQDAHLCFCFVSCHARFSNHATQKGRRPSKGEGGRPTRPRREYFLCAFCVCMCPIIDMCACVYTVAHPRGSRVRRVLRARTCNTSVPMLHAQCPNYHGATNPCID